MLSKIINYFEVQVSNEGNFENRRRFVFTNSSLVVILGLFILMLFHFFFNKKDAALIDFIGFTLVFLNLFLYKCLSKFNLCMGIFIASILFVFCAQHITSPPELQSSIIWFIMLSFGIHFLLKKKHRLVAFILIFALAIISEYLHQTSIFSSKEFSLNEAYDANFIRFFIGLIISYIIGKVVMASEDETLRRLEQKNKESIALSEDYSTLVSVLGHDLNNQVFIIKLEAEKLKEKFSDNSIILDHLAEIEKVTKDMKSILTHVNQMKALEDGKIIINLEKIDPVLAINSSLEYFREKIVQKNLMCTFVPPRKCSQIMAEPVSLVNSVLNNVLSNAIKFSPPKSLLGICIEETSDHVIISISDQGIGIPKDMIDKIFNIKEKTNRSGTEGEKGTGFGMPIVKTYMEKYNGFLEVNSKTKGVNQGTSIKLFFKKAS